MSNPHVARPLDHLVLPTGDLKVSRQRLTALGLKVAPDGLHPFGTENACIYFGGDTFIEMLAVAQRETCEAAALDGNVFVARDQAYRFRNGHEGFSALVMGTQDARADHQAFVKAGISAGGILDFSRPFVAADGSQDEASFRLAFAADLRAPDAFFFTCQRVRAPQVDRTALQLHTNGVVAIREIALSEANPTDFQYLLQEVVQERDVNAHSFGFDIKALNANIAILTPAGLKAFYGLDDVDHQRGVRLRAILFAVRSLEQIANVLQNSAVSYIKVGERIVVKPATGQGAAFAFEAE